MSVANFACAWALEAANTAARSAQGIVDETSGRYRLGAVPLASARASEQQFRNAQLDEIRYTSARLADTAALFQAMGSLPVAADGKQSPRATSEAASQTGSEVTNAKPGGSN